MAKGQHLSRYQQGIVKRYYDQRDTIAGQKLGDLVSELYFCDSAKKSDRLWQQVKTAIAHTPATSAEIKHILETRDVKALAALLQRIA